MHEALRNYAEGIIRKRLERLQNRKWVLFPWIRAWFLMRKQYKIDKLLGKK